MELYLRDQATILDDIKARVRDTGNARWNDSEIYRALNDALGTWHGRVSIPQIYTFASGFTSGTNEYALPSYVDTRTIVPQMKRTVPFQWWGAVAVDDSLTWTDVPGWTVEPNGTGGNTLRFDIPPYSTEGRVLWWGHNQPLPTNISTLSAQLTQAATSATLTDAMDCGDFGYVKVEGEWIQFSSVTVSSTTTLSNLVRGVAGGSADATHDAGEDVYFGVAMPRLDLYRILIDQTIIYLNELYLTDAAARETQIHQQLISFHQGRIDKFWRTWIPQRRARLVLDRRFVSVE